MTDPDTHGPDSHGPDIHGRDTHDGAMATTAGRPVTLEPLPPGWWPLIGGGILAALGPLFGFLVGSMIGRGDGEGLSPLYIWMLVGLLIGGVGALMALMGGHTIYDRSREARESPDDPDDPASPPAGTPPAEVKQPKAR